LGKQFARPYLEKPFTKIGLVEWLNVKALSSSPSKAKKKKINKRWLIKANFKFKRVTSVNYLSFSFAASILISSPFLF
jgi:hypothetical protein